MKTGEDVIKQKARERKAALERVRRYRQDLQVLYEPEEALAVARANARPRQDAVPLRAAQAVGGAVVPLLTGLERAAEAAGPGLPDVAPEPPAAAVNDVWRAFEAEQLAGMEADRQAQLAEEARRREYEREQYRQLGLDTQGGDA